MWEIYVKKNWSRMHALHKIALYMSFSKKEFFSICFPNPSLVTVLGYVYATREL